VVSGGEGGMQVGVSGCDVSVQEVKSNDFVCARHTAVVASDTERNTRW
jgi:hypothetical protein